MSICFGVLMGVGDTPSVLGCEKEVAELCDLANEEDGVVGMAAYWPAKK